MNPIPLSLKAIEGFHRRYQRERINSKKRRLKRRIERLSPTFRFALERLNSDDGLERMWCRRFKTTFGRPHDPLSLKRITLRTARAIERLGLVRFEVVQFGTTFLWLTAKGRRRAEDLEARA